MTDEHKITNEESLTTKELGSTLEKNVEYIFQSAGFKTQRNVKIAKYEIDVLANIGIRKIVIECKNYQKSKLTIRNLIHQWHSKNEIIKAGKIIIVIAGNDIKDSDIKLANKFNIELWNEKDLSYFFELSLKPNELRDKLLEQIDIPDIKISDLYRDDIAQKVIYPILKNEDENEEDTYNHFNHWLRAFVRSELDIEGTSREDRMKHIQLFEDTKEKEESFFFIFKKTIDKSPIEYWNTLSENLQNSKLLPKKTRDKYNEYMLDLKEEHEGLQESFKKNDEPTMRMLIFQRLYDSLISENDNCLFGFDNDELVEVISENEGLFMIRVPSIDEKLANLIDWITTSEHYITIDTENEKSTSYFTWSCQSIEETTEKVFRILDEFYGYEEESTLMDFALL